MSLKQSRMNNGVGCQQLGDVTMLKISSKMNNNEGKLFIDKMCRRLFQFNTLWDKKFNTARKAFFFLLHQAIPEDIG